MLKHFDLPVGERAVKATLEAPQDSEGGLLWLLGRGAARLDSLADRERQAGLFKRDILTFDYTGQGETTGNFDNYSINNHLAEAQAAFDWLKSNYNGSSLTIAGASYGGYIAALLAANNQADALILRAPAIFEPSQSDVKWKDLELQIPLITNGYRQDVAKMLNNPMFAKLSEFAGRILIIQHGEDEVIPAKVLEAYRQALPDADFWTAPGILHSVTASGREAQDHYENYIAGWLE